MSNFLNFIWWDMGPQIFEQLPIRWYGSFFALGFFIAYHISVYLYTRENAPREWVDTLFVYTIIGTVVGARLGHVLFYDPVYYWNNPWTIFKVWEGGLASHGGTIALLLIMLLYSKKTTFRSYFWGVDRLVIVIAFVACLIRLGNLFNSEIVGQPSSSSWAFVFANPIKTTIKEYFPNDIKDIAYTPTQRDTLVDQQVYTQAKMTFFLQENTKDTEKLKRLQGQISSILGYFSRAEDHVFLLGNESFRRSWSEQKAPVLEVEVWGKPRIPGQLIEAIFYLFTFFVVLWGFLRSWYKYDGLTSGIFLVMVFGFRFFIEFFKEVQEEWEKDLLLNQGQMLSIPIILLGLSFIVWSYYKSRQQKK